jgi:hypothetical protein
MNQLNRPAGRPGNRPGCLFYGCLTLAILGLILGGALGIGLYYGVQKFNQTVAEYTAATPTDLPVVTMGDAEYRALEERFATFGADLREGQATAPLLLSADEVNALLNRSQAMEDWKGRVHVQMDGDELRGQVSLPLDPIAQGPILKRLAGRYLNGAARLSVGMENGRLAVRLAGMEVNHRSIPVEIMQRLSTINLADAAYDNPETASLLSRIRAVEVEDGRLVVTPAPAQNAQ